LIRKIKPDIIHTYYLANNGLIASLSGKHPLIHTIMGSDIITFPEINIIFRLLIKYALNTSDIVHVSDETSKNRVLELGCNKDRVFVQEWSVDLSKFSPKAMDNLKHIYNVQYLVLCTAWWKPDCFVDILIKAIPLITREISSIKFILLGGGPEEGKLKDLAEELNVKHYIEFIGRVPEDEMPKYLASSDLVVDTITNYTFFRGRLFKRTQGFGLGQANRQALACGTPVLATNNIIGEKADSCALFHYKQFDHEDLANKLVAIISNNNLIHLERELARDYATQNFDENKNFNNWNNIYMKLVTK
jgi:glycosyltransferase involved in cell wall biosynthesis